MRPAAPAEAAASGAPIALDQPIYRVGSQAVASAKGFKARERVQVVQFGGTAKVLTVAADAKGRVRAQVAVPDTALAGPHPIQFIGWCTAKVAVGSVLVGRLGAGSWPAPGYPAWIWWAGAAVLLLGLGSAGWQLVTHLSGTRREDG